MFATKHVCYGEEAPWLIFASFTEGGLQTWQVHVYRDKWTIFARLSPVEAFVHKNACLLAGTDDHVWQKHVCSSRNVCLPPVGRSQMAHICLLHMFVPDVA